MLFISPPFGNYINLPHARSIKGSFTLQPRPGLISQIIKTLRFSKHHNGWINKIGLRNKGIDWAIHKYKYGFFNFYRNSVISIAILNENEVDKFVKKIPDDMDLEINISCPNTEHALINKNIYKFLNPRRKWCCIKLSPNTSIEEIDTYYSQGFRQFHCSNTLPVKSGGLSGQALIPYTSKLTKLITDKYDDIEIVAGGGIRDIMDIVNYRKNGADHFSISTVCFNPFRFILLYLEYQFFYG